LIPARKQKHILVTIKSKNLPTRSGIVTVFQIWSELNVTKRPQNSESNTPRRAVASQKYRDRAGSRNWSASNPQLGFSFLGEPALIHPQTAETAFSGLWCNEALRFERARRRHDEADWGLTVPVWISALLVSVIIQVLAVKALLALFG